MKYIEVPTRVQVREAPGAVQVNPGAAGAVGGAIAQAGQQVGSEVGAYFAKYAEIKQDADDAAGLTRWDTQIERTKRNVQEILHNEPDETKYMEHLETAFKGLKIDERGMSREARARASEMLNENLKTQRATVFSQYLKADSDRKIATYADAVETQLENGNLEGARAKIDEAVKYNILSQRQAQEMHSRADAEMDRYEVQVLIDDDPEEAERLLEEKTEGGRYRNFKNLKPDTRNNLTGRARQRGIDDQREFITELVKGAELGELIDLETLQEYIEEEKLSPWQGKQYREVYLGKRPQEFDGPRLAQLYRDIDAYNAEEDSEWNEYVSLLGRMIGIPSDHLGRARSMLNAKRNPESVSNGRMATRGFNRITSLFEQGFLGDVATDSRTEKPTNRAEYDRAVSRESRMIDEFQRFLGENPNATNTQANEFIHRLIQTDTDIQAIPLLRGTRNDPPAIEDLDSILREYGFEDN